MAIRRWTIGNIEEWTQVITTITKDVSNYPIVLLYGDLGSGKTTFVNQLIQDWNGVDQASSPTFSIINEYDTDLGLIYHMDFYRLNSIEEVMNIGIMEYLESPSICIIEWPELILPLIDMNHIAINISLQDNLMREVQISYVHKGSN